MLRISSVWRIRQIKFQKQFKKCKHFACTENGKPHKHWLLADFTLFKLDFCNYIFCLIKCCIAIFCIIILNILCILHSFRTFCKHFSTAITSDHSLSVFLCTPSIHPLKYGTHSYCRLKSACGLL